MFRINEQLLLLPVYAFRRLKHARVVYAQIVEEVLEVRGIVLGSQLNDTTATA